MKNICYITILLLLPIIGFAQTPGAKVDGFPRWNDIRRNATRQNPTDNILGEIYRYTPCGEDAITVYDPCTAGILEDIAANTSDSTITVLKQTLCDSMANTFLRYYLVVVDGNLGFSLSPIGDFDASGNAYTPIGTPTLGECQQKTIITRKELCNASLAATGFIAGEGNDLTFGEGWQVARGGTVTTYDFNGYVPATNISGVSNFAMPNPFQITFRDADTAPTPTGWVQRNFDVENPCAQSTATTGSTGIDDGNGSPSNRNAFLFDFTAYGGTPINAFGLDAVDLESDAAFTSAEIRAYGATQNLLQTYIITYPSGSNGNDKIHFVGFERALADVYYVAVIVGDDNGNALAEQLAFDNLRVGVSELALTASNVELVVFSDGSTKCYDNLGAEISCVGATECPDFSPAPTVDYEYLKIAFCSNGNNYIAVRQYVDTTLLATTWLNSALAVETEPSPKTLGFCTNTQDFETTTTTVCANNIAYQRLDYFDNGVFIASEYRLNGLVVAAPLAYTEGDCVDTLKVIITDTVQVVVTDTVTVKTIPEDVKKWNAKFERLDGLSKTYTRCRGVSVIAGAGATGSIDFEFNDGSTQNLPVSLGIFPQFNPMDDDGILADIKINATTATNIFVSTIGCGTTPYECEPSPLIICDETPQACTGWTSTSGTWFSSCCWSSNGTGCN